jgi:plasmid stabilization system protein ParE
MYKVKVSSDAKKDLRSISKYIAKDNPSRAITFTQGMICSFKDKVSIFPKAGMKCRHFYYTVYQGYFIFYDIKDEDQTVELLRVVNSGHCYPKIETS